MPGPKQVQVSAEAGTDNVPDTAVAQDGVAGEEGAPVKEVRRSRRPRGKRGGAKKAARPQAENTPEDEIDDEIDDEEDAVPSRKSGKG